MTKKKFMIFWVGWVAFLPHSILGAIDSPRNALPINSLTETKNPALDGIFVTPITEDPPADFDFFNEDSIGTQNQDIQDEEDQNATNIDEEVDDSKLNAELMVPKELPFHLVYNQRVKNFIHMYTKTKRDLFELALSRYGKYMPSIQAIFARHGLPKELAYLSIVESNLNPRAISRANAVGIWQFMRYTGKLYGLESNLYYDERLNVEKASLAAASHLKDLYGMFHNWELVLAAYNAGAGGVRKAVKKNIRRNKPIDYWSLRLPRETRGYVPAFFAVCVILSDLPAFGFEKIDQSATFENNSIATKSISVPPAVSFEQIENKLGIDKSLLSELNPEIRHYVTPPNKNYPLLIPDDHDVDQIALQSLHSEPLNLMVTHRVRRGETVSSISRKYGIRLSTLYDLNPRIRAKRLKVGMSLIVMISSNGKKQQLAANGKKTRG